MLRREPGIDFPTAHTRIRNVTETRILIWADNRPDDELTRHEDSIQLKGLSLA